ncbi:helix-turn-helix transcriptional regulator [Verrucomicrobiaceae bacterium N1E253]|uniref:Helix-turn-helix transcriptional regulator n=1 Tax=Oceaniferula marina TaxID=2748318 RepID=A0A851GJH4_9BACT|nr:helix-turn-helix transcriptional regulator [Oceaniferula marina]NWK56021.1 helix-turn-helix transcriptional regulator [Oceaniferula marina]
MKFQELHHDAATLQELGRRLARLRIDMNLTQADLARRAGVGKRTLERLEAGETTQTRTLFRIFRELDLFEKLELLLPEPGTRPLHAVKQRDNPPKRASKKKTNRTTMKNWKWGDEA